ncbi:MAG: hypothetical protein E7632_08030 [Ruminococcaceae bacterium]|nr:hypothetical protein [Oscillospiraceae bacterium]
MKWLVLMLPLLLLIGCTNADAANPPGSLTPAPSDTLSTKTVTYMTHRSDYYADEPDYSALMLMGRLNAFQYHSYTHGWTLSITVPDDWLDEASVVKSPDGLISLSKMPEIFHVPDGSWPPDVGSLAAEAETMDISVAESDNLLIVQSSPDYYTYYIPYNGTTFLRLGLRDSGSEPDRALHKTILSSVRLEESPFLLYDFFDMQVYQHSRSLLEILTPGGRYTVTDHPTDTYYEVMGWENEEICITVFTKEEQYYLIFDTITGEISEIHAPEPSETLRLAGISDAGEILSHYRHFHNFARDYRYSIHYITTADCQYVVEIVNGAASVMIYPFASDAAPTEEDIRASFTAMQYTLQTGSFLTVEHEELERIDGTMYFYSYRLSRDYITFSYALSQRLTAECAAAVLHGTLADGSQRYLRGDDGRLLHAGNHPAVSQHYDIADARITKESDTAYTVEVPLRHDVHSPVIGYHTFRYIYENGGWRWEIGTAS